MSLQASSPLRLGSPFQTSAVWARQASSHSSSSSCSQDFLQQQELCQDCGPAVRARGACCPA